MPVDDVEGSGEALARLPVEAVDALAQPLDRREEIVALARERGVLGLDLPQFLFGAQIDGTEPLAVAPQFFKLRLDLGQFGQRLARADPGERGDALGPDF